jgi:adenylylsulfate kinase
MPRQVGQSEEVEDVAGPVAEDRDQQEVGIERVRARRSERVEASRTAMVRLRRGGNASSGFRSVRPRGLLDSDGQVAFTECIAITDNIDCFNKELRHVGEPSESDRTRGGGFTLWLTGLSGSGKTTLAHLVGPQLDRRGLIVEYLDGDTVRTNLSKGLGFSREDRDSNIERIGWVASRLTRHGGAVIVAAISPYAEARAKARTLVEQFGPFVEVYLNVSLEECARRDVKGLYAKAFAGEIGEFTGVSDPYEAPADPDLVLNTEEHGPDESARLLLERLDALGLLTRPEVARRVSAI